MPSRHVGHVVPSVAQVEMPQVVGTVRNVRRDAPTANDGVSPPNPSRPSRPLPVPTVDLEQPASYMVRHIALPNSSPLRGKKNFKAPTFK